MKTVIVYVTQTDQLNSDYKRVLQYEIDKGNILFFPITAENPGKLGEKEAPLYEAISDQVRECRHWKLIWVDDSRNFQNSQNLPYEDYCFATQLKILCGEEDHPKYTASIPTDSFSLLVIKNQGMRSLPTTLPDGLPGHGRYMIYDMTGQGAYIQEENEWKLFFILWLLSQESITMDRLQADRMYRVSVEWNPDRLAEYLTEMWEQFRCLSEQTLDFRVQHAVEDSKISPKRDKKEAKQPAAVPIGPRGHIAFRMFQSAFYWRELKNMTESYRYLLRERREERERVGRASFRKMRRTYWFTSTPKGNRRDYEDMLEKNFAEGNADYEEWEKELDLLDQELDEQLEHKPGAWWWIVAELVIMLLFALCLYHDDLEIGNILYGGLAAAVLCLLAMMLCHTELTGGMQLELTLRLNQVKKKIELSFCKEGMRINSKFDVMNSYKSYVNWEKQRHRQEADDRKQQRENWQLEERLREAEAFCRQLEKFAGTGRTAVPVMIDQAMDKEQALYYPFQWTQADYGCMVRGMKVACPYDFLEKMTFEIEQ